MEKKFRTKRAFKTYAGDLKKDTILYRNPKSHVAEPEYILEDHPDKCLGLPSLKGWLVENNPEWFEEIKPEKTAEEMIEAKINTNRQVANEFFDQEKDVCGHFYCGLRQGFQECRDFIKNNHFLIVKQTKIDELAEKLSKRLDDNYLKIGAFDHYPNVTDAIKKVLSSSFPAAPEKEKQGNISELIAKLWECIELTSKVDWSLYKEDVPAPESNPEPTPSEVEELANSFFNYVWDKYDQQEWASARHILRTLSRDVAKCVLSRFASYERIERAIYDFFIGDGCNEEYSKRTAKNIINKLKAKEEK